jgi:formamidopyrimidine-DNA glycosylase
MPELPEVETVRRSLLPLVVGRRIVGLRPGSFPEVTGADGVEATATRVAGRAVVGVRRRAKYLLLDLDDGTSVVVHLRMTGRLVAAPRNAPPLRFEHLAIELDDGQDLRFADQRKFGRVLHLPPEEVDRLERRLGPEPLASRFTATGLASALLRRPGKLKSVLLDQRLIAGLGNIYVDEALFRARLHPERAANGLSLAEVRRLHRAIRAVLREGLAHRGTTFDSFRDAEGAEGGNQRNLRVYGRGKGGACFRCARPLAWTVIGGRGTTFCPRCQWNG